MTTVFPISRHAAPASSLCALVVGAFACATDPLAVVSSNATPTATRARPADTGCSASKEDRAIAYRTTMVDGLSIAWREAGRKDAPTLLLLHGFPSSSHMFRELMPDLAADFHLVAPDYPGFGNSDAPSVASFAYTFDHLADVLEHYVQAIGLSHFAIYVQDFGGPVGFRLATRHPEWISAIVVQNANAYVEGISKPIEALLRPLWEHRDPSTEAAVRHVFEREGTIAQYRTGAHDFASMSPDAWNMDQYGLDRPGNKDIQLELHADYRTNLERYPEWHAYFAKSQPPMLVVWGKGDAIFTVEGARAYGRDIRNVDFNLLDTGHFALEEEHVAIAAHIRRFYAERGLR